MQDRKEKPTPWLSVPQLGDWDQKGPLPDYSLNFTKIREMRKQNKRDPSRVSLGHEEELIKPPPPPPVKPNSGHGRYHNDYFDQDYQQDRHTPTARRSIFSCFNCCVKA